MPEEDPPEEPEPEVPEAVAPETVEKPEEPEVPEAAAAETVPETVEEPEEPQVVPEEPVLEEAPAPEPVKVEFQVDAKKAHVTVRRDDKKVKAEEDRSYLLLPGEYTYSVTADGYEPLDDIDFTVEEGDDLTIEITMTPIETETKDE